MLNVHAISIIQTTNTNIMTQQWLLDEENDNPPPPNSWTCLHSTHTHGMERKFSILVPQSKLNLLVYTI